MRRIGELNEAIARLKRLRSSGGSQLVHDERFRRALQTLETLEKGETVARRELLRAVAVITQVMCEQLRRHETR